MKKKRVFSLLILIGTLLSSFGLTGCAKQEVILVAYVGDGMKDPMLKIKEMYEADNPNVTIEYSFSGSGTLEETLRSLKSGDLYMPGATKYIESLKADSLVVDSYPVALHVPSIIVRKDQSKVTSWEDLAADSVRVGLPNPELASSGKVCDGIISKSPLDADIRDNITALAADTRDVIGMLMDDKIDAALSWRSAIGTAPDELHPIDIPGDINEIQEIWFAVLQYSEARDEAVAFAEFTSSPTALEVFEQMGFPKID